MCPRDPKFLCLPCAPSAAVQTDGTGLDDLVSAPEMPLEESDDAPGFSEAAGRILMVRSRSMSVRELIAEAESKEHYIDILKRQYLEQHDIELQDSEITEIKVLEND